MKIAMCGDWHGNTHYAIKAIGYAHAQDVELIHHVGDFGIWPGSRGHKYIGAITKTCRLYDLPIVVTLGNHDDWNQVSNLLLPNSYAKFTNYISLAPRVGVVDNMLHVSGAVSVDRGIRVENLSWWPQESLTEADQYTADQIGQQNIEFVVTHDAPAGVLVEYHPDPPDFWKPYFPAAEQNRERCAQIISTVIGDSHPVLVHGHYHYRSIQYDVTISGGGRLRQVHGLAHDYGAVEDNVMIVEV